MDKIGKLLNRANEFKETILRQTSENKNLLILSHLDADGIVSASIISKAILRERGRSTVRIVSDFNQEVLSTVKQGNYDFHVICDLGGGLADKIDSELGDTWIGIDHHQIPSNELNRSNILNAWQFEYNGGIDVCSSGLAYFIARQIDRANTDLAWLAVVAALADRQDQGEGRKLIGLNREIINDAEKVGNLEVMDDLIFYGRATKPIHEAVAYSSTPFIPGLSGSKDAVLAALSSANLKLQEGGRWRTISELSMEEKKKVVEIIIPYLTSSQETSVAVEELIGEVYTLIKEDEYSQLHDAREFGTLLNSCGRLKKAGVGVSICMGDRSTSLSESETILVEYRRTLGSYVQSIVGVTGKIIEGERFALAVGDGIVKEDMVGSLASVLTNVPNFEGKIVLVKTVNQDGQAKVSARKTDTYTYSVNLGLIMREAAIACDGQGGGHDAAAGAKITSSQFEKFLKIVGDKLNGTT